MPDSTQPNTVVRWKRRIVRTSPIHWKQVHADISAYPPKYRQGSAWWNLLRSNTTTRTKWRESYVFGFVSSIHGRKVYFG
jgi:hypothetical protein